MVCLKIIGPQEKDESFEGYVGQEKASEEVGYEASL